MKKTKKVAAVVSAILASTIALGALSACNGGGKMSTVADSKDISFTSIESVQITDEYAANALDKELTYLTDTLDPDRLLYWFYVNAALTPDASSGYGGGWESALIGGHTMGHYLSALAQAYANKGTSEADRKKVNERIVYVVNALKECQDNAENAGAQAGFLWGAKTIIGKGPEIQFDNVESRKTNIATEAWVPWYTMHKIIAGLYDVTVYTGNETAKSVLLNLCDWVANRALEWDEVMQSTVLAIEYGGMNDILYSVYALTGEEKYARTAHMFDEEPLFDNAIDANTHYLSGLHANTTIPKILGALNRYVVLNGKTLEGKTIDATRYLAVAEAFFDTVVQKHTYITGGNSRDEHFGRDEALDSTRDNINCETCNTYNMLKLARTLFTITGDKKYLDYYENTYINAIWSSQNPDSGMTMYFQPMGSGYFKVYSTAEESFWCCTGSGMESMTKLNDSIYYDAGNATYVSLYVSSSYVGENVSLEQTADLENSDTVSFRITKGKTILRLRVPDWTASYSVTVNGKSVALGDGDLDFIPLSVKKGDKVELTLEKQIVAYNLPDGENTYAFRYGPYVLSAKLGTEDMATTGHGVSVVVPKESKGGNEIYALPATNVRDFMVNINDHMTVNGDGTFTLHCADRDFTYMIHFRNYTERYAIYMKFAVGEVEQVVEPFEWKQSDSRQVGYGQYEADLDQDNDNSTGSTSDPDSNTSTSRYANAGGSFSYTAVAVNKNAENRLVVTFTKADNGKTVKIVSGSTVLYEATLNYTGADKTYNVEIALPDALVKASNGTIPVTVSGIDGAESARLCGYLLSQYLVNNTRYFVDCGDYNPATVSEGDHLGTYNSVTDQVYGKDSVTGKSWGIVDTYDKTWSGAAPQGVSTNSTWAYEFDLKDGVAKESSNRYTKNQYETNVSRLLSYKFELEDGVYQVRVYFADPWGCSANPSVAANGKNVLANAACNTELMFTVNVSGGQLQLDFTSADKAINLCYIMIVGT